MRRTTAYLTEAEKFDFIEEDIPALAPDDVLYRTLSVGLCHSDIPAYLGESEIVRSEHPYPSMRRGVKFPTVLGHEPVCVVEDVGSAVTKFKPGDVVTGLISNAFSTHIVNKTDGVVKIPRTSKRIEYCLGEPLGCIVNIARAAAPEYGDYVAVVGCGMMGLLTINALRSAGLKEIIAIDLLDSRLENAQNYGATAIVNAKENVEQRCFEITNGNGVDVVIEIAGNLKGLNTATSIVRIAERYSYRGRGKILAASLYGRVEQWDPNIGYNLMLRAPIIHATHPMYAMDLEDNIRKGVDGYVNGTLPLDEFITHEFKFDQINEAFALMKSNDPSYQKGVLLF